MTDDWRDAKNSLFVAKKRLLHTVRLRPGGALQCVARQMAMYFGELQNVGLGNWGAEDANWPPVAHYGIDQFGQQVTAMVDNVANLQNAERARDASRSTAAPPPSPSPNILSSVPPGNNENDSKIAEGNARVQWHNPWGDELQPYRLLMYTCHMAEGGTCVLDKFLATTTLKQLDWANPFELDSCHMLKPWLFPSSPFAFHFRFVRRPRKFANKAKALLHWRRRRGRHATREVGRVELHGFRDCEKACGTDDGGELEDIPLAGANYFEDPLQGWKRRKR